MHRNDHPSAPGGMHTDGDPQRGIAPTTVTAALMNALQEELANFIESRGITLDKNDNTQLKMAILDAVTTTVTSGDFVTHSEFELHTQGGDPHQQYALESMLGDAAGMDVGTTGGTVASGDHAHAQYELKSNLKGAAYKDVGMEAGKVAPGVHTHAEMQPALTAYCPAANATFGVNQQLAIFSIKAETSERPARISLPVFSLDCESDGTEPGFRCYVRVNHVDYISNLVWVPNDRYGNGLAYTWTPMVTFTVPANTPSLTIEVRLEHINGMTNPRYASGYAWLEIAG